MAAGASGTDGLANVGGFDLAATPDLATLVAVSGTAMLVETTGNLCFNIAVTTAFVSGN